MIPQPFLNTIATKHHLSKAELEVLSLAMEGESIGAIADLLKISEDAVRKRLSEVYHKFQIVGRGPVKLPQLQRQLMKQYQEQLKAQGDLALNISLGTSYHLTQPQINNSMDWDGAPDVSVFYGRATELALLKDWIVNQGCRLVSLLGIGGVGKTVLGVRLAHQIQEHFESLIWRSLYFAPSLQEFLDQLIKVLSLNKETPNLNTVDQQISWLVSYFRSYRCLVIVDGFESILSRGKLAGTYREGYDNYGKFLKRIGEEPSKSCVIITSREKINEISYLQGETSRVKSLKVEGLGEDARFLLKEKGLSAEENWQQLIEDYRGNPLMLKLVAATIQEVFDGNVKDFLETTFFTHDVTGFVRELLDQLSELEAKIIVQMANEKEPIILQQLRENLSGVSSQDVISAVASLRQRALVEKSRDGFTLPPVIRATLGNGYHLPN
ncbi:transcriptional regulator, LuxR family [Gloeothece citriformis PCC 7424]|uniref:Transcriptional regulator, LuxR family n=1 Tax=Gloeothece citriformis (strain PCC 7424) TaxID=65393 RepID=B7KCV5_GLOC7|nr:helix-turn-helix transcriptional regulator [Gloeothece citriformis]ACK71656.1 transcriptional regulator, LuxR family [Gloeothece citriformis PCC 7424]